VPESKYQAGFGVIILGQNAQTFMIPILPYYMMSIRLNYSKIPLYTFQLKPAQKSTALIIYPVDRSARHC